MNFARELTLAQRELARAIDDLAKTTSAADPLFKPQLIKQVEELRAARDRVAAAYVRVARGEAA